jgi:hypothetical protein
MLEEALRNMSVPTSNSTSEIGRMIRRSFVLFMTGFVGFTDLVLGLTEAKKIHDPQS